MIGPQLLSDCLDPTLGFPICVKFEFEASLLQLAQGETLPTADVKCATNGAEQKRRCKLTLVDSYQLFLTPALYPVKYPHGSYVLSAAPDAGDEKGPCFHGLPRMAG